MKILAGFLFLLNTILFATYYAVAKEALGRFDPVIFTFFEMQLLVPVALCIIALSWQHVTREVVKRGIILGSSLCLALFTIAIALKYTTATSTAFFPALNGFLAAIFARFFLRRSTTKATWAAGIVSTAGTAVLIESTAMGNWRGVSIAFLGGLFFTFYIFLSENVGTQFFAPSSPDTPSSHISPWPLFGIELLTMGGWASLVVLLFGNWQAVHPALPGDALVLLYVAGACTFLPTLITVLMQKYISAVTVSFIYILEPILAAVIANIYLREILPLPGYLGGLLVVAGAVIHTWGTAFSRAHPEVEIMTSSNQNLTMPMLPSTDEVYAAHTNWASFNEPPQTPAPAQWSVQPHRITEPLSHAPARSSGRTAPRQRRKVRLQRLEQMPPSFDSMYGDSSSVNVSAESTSAWHYASTEMGPR